MQKTRITLVLALAAALSGAPALSNACVGAADVWQPLPDGERMRVVAAKIADTVHGPSMRLQLESIDRPGVTGETDGRMLCRTLVDDEGIFCALLAE